VELDLLALVILGSFAGLGAIRGTLRSGVRLGCWIVGYAAAFLGAPTLAPLVSGVTGLQAPLSHAAAGAAILLGIGLLGAVLIRVLERVFETEHHRAGMDGMGGAAFGVAQGALLVLLLGWLALWVQAADEVGAELPFSPPSKSLTANVAGSVFGSVAGLAVGEDGPGGRFAVRLAGDPAAPLGRVRSLTQNPRIVGLQKDPVYCRHVRHDAFDEALNQGSFLGIAHDGTLRHELAELGLVGEAAATDPRLFRNDVHQTLTEVSPKVRRLAESEELRALAEDPEVQSALQRGDTLALLRDPRVQEFIGRVLASEDHSSRL
jgi:uncharacterized membrane protein required for colicin V production